MAQMTKSVRMRGMNLLHFVLMVSSWAKAASTVMSISEYALLVSMFSFSKWR